MCKFLPLKWGSGKRILLLLDIIQGLKCVCVGTVSFPIEHTGSGKSLYSCEAVLTWTGALKNSCKWFNDPLLEESCWCRIKAQEPELRCAGLVEAFGSYRPCSSFLMAPKDPQLGAAGHPHLSSWIWALSSSVLHFCLHSMLSDVQVPEPVSCWGWGELTPMGYAQEPVPVWLFWAGSLSPNIAFQPHDSFQFQQGKTRTFSSEDTSGQQRRGKEKKPIYICVYVNKACLFFAHFFMQLWSTLLFP